MDMPAATVRSKWRNYWSGSERQQAGTPDRRCLLELRSRGLATRSDSAGRFRLNGIPPGAHVVVVRALGFDSLVANLRVAQGEVLDLDFLLTRSAQSLAPVKVEADGGLERMRLAEFDERRVIGFGRFIDRSVFEANSESQVDRVLLSRIPGLRTNRVSGKLVLASQRDAKLCYAQVIVNGISAFNGVPNGSPDAKRAREMMLLT